MKILIPVDGSKYSKAAADFVASRTTLIGKKTEVELLNVQAPIPARAAQAIGKETVKSYHETESARTLKPTIATLTKAGLAPRTGYVLGHPAEEIAKRAERSDIDLIVMGSHGHGALAQLMFGSVTNGVLAHTKKPMLLVRDRAAPKSDSLRVGIAVDGSKFGRAAVRYVLKHIALFGLEPDITLLHVVPDFAGIVMPDMTGMALPQYSGEEIEAMQRAAFARKRKLDVLVMGSHGQGAFKNAVLGSVVTRVAHICPTPLLLVREA